MQEIYRLVKHVRFSAEYVEGLSPADRKLFIMYHNKELEEANKKQNQNGHVPGPTIGGDPGE